MKIRYQFHALPLIALLGAAAEAEGQVQPQLARRWFDEATRLCERDAGRLWGVSLCGPMVIVDQASRTRATSQPEPEGPPPRFPAFVDGPVSWGGSTWFSWPLSMLADKPDDARQQVMLHGLFHRVQPELGFTANNGSNEHLDTREGRVWMQLEWRALRRALESSASEKGASHQAGDPSQKGDRAEAIADALAFRRERRRLFPGATDHERREEIKEGLPSYTGVAVWANSPADARHAAAPPASVDASLVGSFAYISGPPYGVLLDEVRPGWRREVRGTSDLGDLLAAAIDRPLPTDLVQAAARYDAVTLRAAEDARDQARQARVAELHQRFVDGPVLTTPAAGSRTSDSTGAVGIPGAGTVLFRNFTLSAPWGRLHADNGVLLAAGEATLSVPVTTPLEGTTLKGDGWSATLNPGWVVRPAARPGSFTIVREE
jgi:hypothetical protein